jgi:long-chain acyl-CoA synthetase
MTPYHNLAEILDSSYLKYPHSIAIVFGRKKITYKTLHDLTDQIAAGLIKLGIKSQDRVALFLDNCPEFVISYFAVLKAQAVVVPINYMFKIEEAKYILEDTQARCLITSRTYVDMAQELRLRLDSLKYIITTSGVKEDIPDFGQIRNRDTGILEKAFSEGRDINKTAVILYTSGTTGHPKGAVLSHHNLISNAIDCAKAIRVTHRDAVICILPLFHSFAATVCMNLPLLVAGKTVIMKSVRPFKRIIRAIRKNRVSVFVAVPSIYNILKETKLPRLLDSLLIKLFNPLKICISGAAALPVETLIKFEKKFRIPLLEGYGLTEASPVVTLNPIKGRRRPGSIGLVLSKNIELKVIDDQGKPLGLEQTGELLVRGPNVMQGYYRNPQASQETLKEGWLHTGDMARIDDYGYVYIVGRKKEMINVRGFNVYPREIEEVLYQNPSIKEAAVIGVADEHKGEAPKAFVVLKESLDLSEHDVLQYLRERLASYKIPKHVEFRAELPKNTSGKILKRLLKDEENQRK